MTRTYRLPLSVVTDMSRISIATRSQRWPIETWRMARKGRPLCREFSLPSDRVKIRTTDQLLLRLRLRRMCSSHLLTPLTMRRNFSRHGFLPHRPRRGLLLLGNQAHFRAVRCLFNDEARIAVTVGTVSHWVGSAGGPGHWNS